MSLLNFQNKKLRMKVKSSSSDVKGPTDAMSLTILSTMQNCTKNTIW